MKKLRTSSLYGPSKLTGVSPGGPVPIREIGAEVGQVVPFRPQVVVNHVEDHRDRPLVALVDEPLQPFGAPVGRLHGEGIDAVIPPAPRAGELGDRHQLDRVHPEVRKLVETPGYGAEGALRRKGADVQLIDRHIGQGNAAPAVILPTEGMVRHARGAVHAGRLEMGRRVGPFHGPIKAIQVIRPCGDIAYRAPITHRVPLHAAEGPVRLDCTSCANGAQTMKEHPPPVRRRAPTLLRNRM